MVKEWTAVLTMISSTQALRLIYSENRIHVRAAAAYTIFGEETTAQMHLRRIGRMLKKNTAPVIGNRDTGSFYLELLSPSHRLLARLIDQKHRQILLDAALLPISAALPNVFHASARMDWDGKEVLFPPAATVALLETGFGLSLTESFGCAEKINQFDCGFTATGNAITFLPKSLQQAATGLSFSPLSAPFSPAEPGVSLKSVQY